MCVCVFDAENGPLDMCVERTGWVYLLFYRLVGDFSVSVFVCDCWLAFEVVFTSVCVRARACMTLLVLLNSCLF